MPKNSETSWLYAVTRVLPVLQILVALLLLGYGTGLGLYCLRQLDTLEELRLFEAGSTSVLFLAGGLLYLLGGTLEIRKNRNRSNIQADHVVRRGGVGFARPRCEAGKGPKDQ